jgi:predicted kinase
MRRYRNSRAQRWCMFMVRAHQHVGSVEHRCRAPEPTLMHRAAAWVVIGSATVSLRQKYAQTWRGDHEFPTGTKNADAVGEMDADRQHRTQSGTYC